MKIFGTFPRLAEEGYVRLIPDDGEDIWTIYNIINVGDVIRSDALRKVVNETSSGTVTTSKVKTQLTIRSEKINVDLKEGIIHVQGRTVCENKYVKVGAYHTLDIGVERSVSVGKVEWDSYCLERLRMALDPAANSDLMAIVMQEGLAYVCLITRSMTVERDKIHVNIPRKRPNFMNDYKKQMDKFHQQLLDSLLKHANFDALKCIILASPGFYKDNFFKFITGDRVLVENKVIAQNKSKFLLVHSSTGFKHSLQQILQDPKVVSQLENVQVVDEISELNRFMKLLDKDSDRAIYGPKHVLKAMSMAAVETLLIVDELLRDEDVVVRKKYRSLVDDVGRRNGKVRILSTQHSAGKQIAMMTGVCAILRFPVEEDEDSQ